MTGTEYAGFALMGLACGIWLALPELRRRARMARGSRWAKLLADGGTIRRT